MEQVFARVAKWNSLRYERVLHLGLLRDLLQEEHTEWLDAETSVKKLDGLCDIVFVAMGGLWKANVDLNDVEAAHEQANKIIQRQVELDEPCPAMYISTYINVMYYDNDYPLIQSLILIINAALAEMAGMGLTIDEVMEALLIVCDSNDSKSIVKVESSVKANIDKGPYFKAPEPRLEALLEKVHARFS